MQIILLKADKWASSRLAVQRFLKNLSAAEHGRILVIPEGVDVRLLELTGDAMPAVIEVHDDGTVEVLKPKPQIAKQDVPLALALEDA